ncbi:hypothetical protein [Pontibacter fetidus]|uniref:Uncharacterized protein n=1 Tax=Pontibacter fetidus TaxID=2700082 RepID=A0A6B2GWF1_9BACT|nr:hypothetical protein [Pontibacter fetidus]NDK55145.1 hypothetical protein [Pontibacter fetidus]
MFISLYSEKKLKQLKTNILIAGAFLVLGGAYALFRELQLPDPFYREWLYAAVLLVITGLVCIAIAKDYILLHEAYFSMNPNRLSFRLTFFSREYVLPWSQLTAVRVTENSIVFELQHHKTVTLRLSNIPDEQVARHIRASIGLAAMQQNIQVNNVPAQGKGVIA